MFNQKRRALEDFDNPHDFERMAADILNAQGYDGVEPMAPGGGADGGRDIRFRDGEARGVAFVSLEKGIQDKFKRDLAKYTERDSLIALFCNVDVSPAVKLRLAKEAIAKDCRLEVFDLERLRSLLDTSLKEIRRRYLGIDDAITARLQADVRRLLRFPEAVPDTLAVPTLIEELLVAKLPRRLFEVLLNYDDDCVSETPGVGSALARHVSDYHEFRRVALRLEQTLLTRIGATVTVRFTAGWTMYLRYFWLRAGGSSRAKIEASGDFLNYDITWDDAERVYRELWAEPSTAASAEALLKSHEALNQAVSAMAQRL
jgi:hypothetical protein